MLAGGLMALAASLIGGVWVWVVWGTPLAFIGTASCGSMTVAMLLPWKQRHNPSGEDPVVWRGDRAVDSRGRVNPLFVSTAGVTLNPTGATFGHLGGVIPYVVLLVAFVLPLLCGLVEGQARSQRLAAVVIGWSAFVTLFVRHIRREIESDGTRSRGVPL
jgi:hypothetical protein